LTRSKLLEAPHIELHDNDGRRIECCSLNNLYLGLLSLG
jgi:hypothetical protein